MLSKVVSVKLKIEAKYKTLIMIEITDLMEENIFTSEENFQVDEREENGMTEPVSTFFVDQAFAPIPQ